MRNSISILQTSQYIGNDNRQLLVVDFTFNTGDKENRYSENWRCKIDLYPVQSCNQDHPDFGNCACMPIFPVFYRQQEDGRYASSTNPNWKKSICNRFYPRIYKHVIRLLKKDKIAFDSELFWKRTRGEAPARAHRTESIIIK